MSSVVLPVAAKPKPRKIVLKIHADHQKLFVINEIGVVFRLVLLDELAFEQKGFRLVFRLDHLHFTNHFHHCRNLRLGTNETPTSLKIASDPPPQVLGLAHEMTWPKRSFMRYTPED